MSGASASSAARTGGACAAGAGRRFLRAAELSVRRYVHMSGDYALARAICVRRSMRGIVECAPSAAATRGSSRCASRTPRRRPCAAAGCSTESRWPTGERTQNISSSFEGRHFPSPSRRRRSRSGRPTTASRWRMEADSAAWSRCKHSVSSATKKKPKLLWHGDAVAQKQNEFIYMVSAGLEGPIKIGKSRRLRSRLAELQTCNYEQIYILSLVPSISVSEHELHAKFSHLRIRGEWFRRDVSLIEYIESLPKDCLISFLGIPEKCPNCDCRGRAVVTSNGIFASMCMRCGTVHSGTETAEAVSLQLRECSHCHRKTNIIRKGLCGACREYKRRTGTDRPLQESMGPCIVCGVIPKNWLSQDRCPQCLMHLRKTGSDRVIRTACSHCERKIKLAGHGLCGACLQYRRRHGKNRPVKALKGLLFSSKAAQ